MNDVTRAPSAVPTTQPVEDLRKHPRTDPITDLDAHALSHAIHTRAVSCREVMQAYLKRIHRLNPAFNAIVNLAPDDQLLAEAVRCDNELSKGQSRGFLHGVPQAIKDAADAVGFATTKGSPLMREHRPAVDSLMTARMKAAGGIVIGKTNVPEFGLGSHTFNSVFGTTLNAWDRSRTAGGSSGGAAVALAQRLLPLADGSDFMGSLRNPAAWNHVYGLRPSQGRVPRLPLAEVWVNQLVTEGPMARTVRDLARLLSIQAGYDAAAPLSIACAANASGSDFMPPEGASLKGRRIAWLGDLGGHLAVEPGILEVCEAALKGMQAAGAIVEPIAHGFDADAVWQAWLLWRRALVSPNVAAAIDMAQAGGQSVAQARAQIKPEALWEHDQGQALKFVDFMQASQVRTMLYERLRQLLLTHDALALPVVQAWPFEAAQRWPQQLAGRPMDTYHRWMESTLYATFAGLPAISLPAGFDASGRWPMGLQLIGRPQGDAELLHIAAAHETTVADLLLRRPPEPG